MAADKVLVGQLILASEWPQFEQRLKARDAQAAQTAAQRAAMQAQARCNNAWSIWRASQPN